MQQLSIRSVCIGTNLCYIKDFKITFHKFSFNNKFLSFYDIVSNLAHNEHFQILTPSEKKIPRQRGSTGKLVSHFYPDGSQNNVSQVMYTNTLHHEEHDQQHEL